MLSFPIFQSRCSHFQSFNRSFRAVHPPTQQRLRLYFFTLGSQIHLKISLAFRTSKNHTVGPKGDQHLPKWLPKWSQKSLKLRLLSLTKRMVFIVWKPPRATLGEVGWRTFFQHCSGYTLFTVFSNCCDFNCQNGAKIQLARNAEKLWWTVPNCSWEPTRQIHRETHKRPCHPMTSWSF